MTTHEQRAAIRAASTGKRIGSSILSFIAGLPLFLFWISLGGLSGFLSAVGRVEFTRSAPIWFLFIVFAMLCTGVFFTFFDTKKARDTTTAAAVGYGVITLFLLRGGIILGAIPTLGLAAVLGSAYLLFKSWDEEVRVAKELGVIDPTITPAPKGSSSDASGTGQSLQSAAKSISDTLRSVIPEVQSTSGSRTSSKKTTRGIAYDPHTTTIVAAALLAAVAICSIAYVTQDDALRVSEGSGSFTLTPTRLSSTYVAPIRLDTPPESSRVQTYDYSIVVCNRTPARYIYVAIAYFGDPEDAFTTIEGGWRIPHGQCTETIPNIRFGDMMTSRAYLSVVSLANEPLVTGNMLLCVGDIRFRAGDLYRRRDHSGYNCAPNESIRGFDERTISRSDTTDHENIVWDIY